MYEEGRNIVKFTRFSTDGTETDDGYYWADMPDGLCVAHYQEANDMVNRWDRLDRNPAGATYYVRDLIKHVTHISEELNTVASGDLTTEIELLSDKDIMGKALVHMVDSLNKLFGEINVATA